MLINFNVRSGYVFVEIEFTKLYCYRLTVDLVHLVQTKVVTEKVTVAVWLHSFLVVSTEAITKCFVRPNLQLSLSSKTSEKVRSVSSLDKINFFVAQSQWNKLYAAQFHSKNLFPFYG